MIQINGRKFGSQSHPQALLPRQAAEDGPAQPAPTVVVIDDDDAFREELALNLIESNFGVVEFGDGHAALDFFAAGQPCDVILVDWKMPSLSGGEILNRLRASGLRIPVVVMTASCDERTEEAALDRGAVDVLEKSRSPSIMAKRLRIIANGTKPLYCRDAVSDVLTQGQLTLKIKTHRAFWRGEPVPLTVTEFRIVCLLASRATEDVPYREIYDVVHGKEFRAGDGANGFHANVRSLIRHVRRKFRALDADFAAIENYPGFGYRWRTTEPRRAGRSETFGTVSRWPDGAMA